METVKQYRLLKLAFENGSVRRLNDIQNYVPITLLAEDMHLNYNTLCKRLLNPNKLTVADINYLCQLADLTPAEIFGKINEELARYAAVE